MTGDWQLTGQLTWWELKDCRGRGMRGELQRLISSGGTDRTADAKRFMWLKNHLAANQVPKEQYNHLLSAHELRELALTKGTLRAAVCHQLSGDLERLASQAGVAPISCLVTGDEPAAAHRGLHRVVTLETPEMPPLLECIAAAPAPEQQHQQQQTAPEPAAAEQSSQYVPQPFVQTDTSEEVVDDVVCVADVHGNPFKLQKLLEQLEAHMGTDELAQADMIFLGDYCDRGMVTDVNAGTRGAIDFLVQLRKDRLPGKTHFVMGNVSSCILWFIGTLLRWVLQHDLGFGAYIGALPGTVDPGQDVDAIGLGPFYGNHVKGTDFREEVAGGMHIVGRQWGSVLNRENCETFKSYGIDLGRSQQEQNQAKKKASSREALVAAVHDEHKTFLASLPWIWERNTAFYPGKIKCIHAGLTSNNIEEQLHALRERDLAAKVCGVGGEILGGVMPVTA